jgi:hypothetical protein
LNEERQNWESLIRPLVEENEIKQGGDAENRRLMPWLQLLFYRSTWIIK